MEVPNTKVAKKGIGGGRCGKVTFEMLASMWRCSMDKLDKISRVQGDVQARHTKLGIQNWASSVQRGHSRPQRRLDQQGGDSR